ncbi:hypothetical protein M409DRAFT_68816 [Zasmidium cellare ATCC 36951]|uniref:Uncharacterized protein n=1 Tax=Zasmidium cellare ATCC 36951 TaxID=1080233 RepID=A0A6A6CAZ8_ZASCE|nr:uncharacterized protein M409DRAFT_68816 [Zasmidium cellare ATCC 36951]KAF2162819.1 hypothetical protein M409DRAFT_68816 [Zasmidium cellare ATCC 36951]
MTSREARRSPSVCLFCQARQAALGRRRTSTISKRKLQTVALRPEDDGFLFSKAQEQTDVEKESPAAAVKEAMRQWKLYNPIDELREAALGFDALWKRRDLRLEVLRNLSNPWPEKPPHVHHPSRGPPQPPEAQAALIPHEVFRQRVKEATTEKPVRQLLRGQLLRAQWPKEIYRVVAVAMMNKDTARYLSTLYEPLMRALYRCRDNVSDPEVLKALNIIITRLKYADLKVEPPMLFMALKFAARSRSLPAMKKYLKVIRDTGLGITSNVFRSVIAKFSIGHRGLGEIRNGRWRRQDLFQVLTGFEDAKDLPKDQQYHLGAFLVREDWQYLHGWVAVLARCKASDTVWQEWLLWKESDSRKSPRQLELRSGGVLMTSKARGDYWFVEQMTYSGDIERAWQMLKETDISFRTLKNQVKDKLLEHIEYATIWDDSVREAMVDKYARDLAKIEEALGVKWIPGEVAGEGQHELYMDQEEALDKLGEDGWRLDEDYGYPWETSPIVPETERALHDAAECPTSR